MEHQLLFGVVQLAQELQFVGDVHPVQPVHPVHPVQLVFAATRPSASLSTWEASGSIFHSNFIFSPSLEVVTTIKALRVDIRQMDEGSVYVLVTS
jgi:hypothetical protein